MRGYAEPRSRTMHVYHSDLVLVNLKALRKAILHKIYIRLIVLVALFRSFELVRKSLQLAKRPWETMPSGVPALASINFDSRFPLTCVPIENGLKISTQGAQTNWTLQTPLIARRSSTFLRRLLDDSRS